MKRNRNIIVADFKVDKEWQFGQSFVQESRFLNWEFHGYNNCGLIKSKFERIKRYILYFMIPMRYFFQYKQFNLFVAYQQFYGLILAYYLRIFCRKEKGKIIILTFIYKRKKGLIGKIYHRFIQYSVESTYIKKIICFSRAEQQYYKDIFSDIAYKFEFVRLGKSSHGFRQIKNSSEYLMSAGRSNRDYSFLLDALENTNYNIKIVTDNLSDENKKKLSGRIQLYDHTFGLEYLNLLQHAKIIIIPLEDSNISSGQLVALQAMEMGVPVIILGSNAVDDYIENGVNGYILKKNKKYLIDTLNGLCSNEKLYRDISVKAQTTYWKYGSIHAMAGQIVRIIEQEDEC